MFKTERSTTNTDPLAPGIVRTGSLCGPKNISSDDLKTYLLKFFNDYLNISHSWPIVIFLEF